MKVANDFVNNNFDDNNGEFTTLRITCMKADLIPTVRSLLAQNAISVSGDEALITRLSSVLRHKTHVFKPNAIYDYCPHERQEPTLIDSINRPITEQVLYSIELLPERFTLTAHIHSATGCDSKTIHTKLNPNLNLLGNTFNAIYRRLDESQLFMICRNCKQLVSAELCNSDTCASTANHTNSDKQSAHQPCSATFKQSFDTRLVDRISRYGDVVSVFKGEEQIEFYISSTDWPHPHTPFPCDEMIDTLPLSATLDEVNALRLKLEAEQRYPAPCYHCKVSCNDGDAMDLASFVDFDTDAIVCYGCASEQYGIVY